MRCGASQEMEKPVPAPQQQAAPQPTAGARREPRRGQPDEGATMSKRLRIDQDKFHRFLAQGRGQGHGATYQPWWQIGDFSSSGNRWRTSNSLTGFRLHHLFSELEYTAFLHAWGDPATLDIREHYPLLPLNLTLGIAALLKVRHPFNTRDKLPVPQQVDLLITRRAGLEAWMVMTDEEAESRVGKAKFAIAEHFWGQRNVKVELKLMSKLKTPKSVNLDWIFDQRRAAVDPPYQPGRVPLHDFLIEAVVQQPGINSLSLATLAEVRRGVRASVATPAIRRLLAEQVLSAEIDTGSPQTGLYLYPGREA